MAYPAGYKYTKSHEWVSADTTSASVGITSASVGITDYAQHSLGDIVFVELPKLGDTVEAGKIFGSVESVKAVSDLYAPVSGTVTEINEELSSAPEKINDDANATWIYKCDLSNADELNTLDTLLDAATYENFVSEETGH